jgi:hypothetical protein
MMQTEKSIKEMFGRLIVLLLTLLIAVHGYFFFTFGTLDPCTAATFKVVNQTNSETDSDNELAFSARIETQIRGEGLLACYWIGVTGDAPEAIEKRSGITQRGDEQISHPCSPTIQRRGTIV